MALYKYVDLTGLGHFKDKILVEAIIESGPNANITETNKAPSVKATYDYIQDEISDVVDQMTTALSTKLSSVNYDSVNKKITATNGGTKDVVTVATLRNDIISTMDESSGTPVLVGGSQSDWSQTDSTASDFIKNKPTIPTVASEIDEGETGYTTGDQVYNYLLADKGALVSVFSELKNLIPYITFTSGSHNAQATIDALENAIEVLDVDNYRVIKSLTRVTLSNNADFVVRESRYTSTVNVIDPLSEVISVSILMGNTDITSTAWDSNTKTITVASVTDPLTITIVADEITLPAGYTRLSYISATGSQYFDTGLTEGDVERAKYEVEVTSQTYRKGNHILSSRQTYFPFLRTTSGGDGELGAMNRANEDALTGESKIFNWSFNQRYKLEGIFDRDNGDCIVDGETIYHVTRGGSTSLDSALTAFNYTFSTAQDFTFHGNVYSMSIYGSNDTCLRRFVPCKNSSNVAGLYDLINEVFYTSDTETAFVAGEEV